MSMRRLELRYAEQAVKPRYGGFVRRLFEADVYLSQHSSGLALRRGLKPVGRRYACYQAGPYRLSLPSRETSVYQAQLEPVSDTGIATRYGSPGVR
jgi:hypothetical protein